MNWPQGCCRHPELYDELWPIVLEAEGLEPSRREVIAAKWRAAELVQQIRQTTDRVRGNCERPHRRPAA